MSGIGALVNFNQDGVRQGDAQRMLQALQRFGRDSADIKHFSKCWLLHCLQKTTHEDAYEQQPLNIQNRYTMVFDGRIDNRNELAVNLGIPADELKMRSDSSLAASAYSKYKDKAYNYIVGVFAIIIFDQHDNTLKLVRDQLGMRVLHFHRSDERVFVASSPTALFSQPGVPKVLNKTRLAEHMVYAGLDSRPTFYENIYRVPPGCYVVFDEHSTTTVRYWDAAKLPRVRYSNDNEYVSEFKKIFETVVQSQLRSRAAIGADLTGGLDSSTVAVTAAKILSSEDKPLHTFTHVPSSNFEGKDTDKTYWSEEQKVKEILAQCKNMDHTFVRFSHTDAVEKIQGITRKYNNPSSGPLNNLWTDQINEIAAQKGINVYLTGEMGNMTMSSDGLHSLAEYALNFQFVRLFKELKAFPSKQRFKLFKNRVVKPFVPRWLFRKIKDFRNGDSKQWQSFGFVNKQFADKIELQKVIDEDDFDIYFQPGIVGHHDRANQFRSYVDTACHLQEQRATFGIDIRVPCFDRRVVEFCQGIPQNQFLRDGVNRWLVRRLMHGELPVSVLDNTKSGLQSAEWLDVVKENKQLFSEWVASIAADDELSEIIDVPRMQRAIDSIPELDEPISTSLANSLKFSMISSLVTAQFVRENRRKNR